MHKPTLLGIAGHGGYNACPKNFQPSRNVKKGNGDLRAYPCPEVYPEEMDLLFFDTAKHLSDQDLG